MSTEFEKVGLELKEKVSEFFVLTDTLSKNSLSRVCKMFAAFPVEQEEININVRQPNELEAANLGIEIQKLKMALALESMRLDAEAERVKLSQQERMATVPDHIEKPSYAQEDNNE